MRAQKKLLHIVLIGQLIVISWFRYKVRFGPFPSRAGEGFTDFEREQDATDRTPERYGDSGCRRRRDDLPHLGCMLKRVNGTERNLRTTSTRTFATLEAAETARDDVADRACNMHGWAFLADRQARSDRYRLSNA